MRKRTEPYKVKQNIFINIEGNKKEQLEDICYHERKTITQKIQELIDIELRKKAVALEVKVNPARIPYVYEQPTLDSIISSKPIISAFSRCSTVSDAFHQLLDEKLSKQDLEDFDRRYRNLGAALVQAKANVNNVITR